MKSLRVFRDTEFTSFEEPRLLPVGLVAEDGRECYLELSGPHCDITEFVGDMVLTGVELRQQHVDVILKVLRTPVELTEGCKQ